MIIFALAAGDMAVAVALFLLGVYIGRRIERGRS